MFPVLYIASREHSLLDNSKTNLIIFQSIRNSQYTSGLSAKIHYIMVSYRTSLCHIHNNNHGLPFQKASLHTTWIHSIIINITPFPVLPSVFPCLSPKSHPDSCTKYILLFNFYLKFLKSTNFLNFFTTDL